MLVLSDAGTDLRVVDLHLDIHSKSNVRGNDTESKSWAWIYDLIKMRRVFLKTIMLHADVSKIGQNHEISAI